MTRSSTTSNILSSWLNKWHKHQQYFGLLRRITHIVSSVFLIHLLLFLVFVYTCSYWYIKAIPKLLEMWAFRPTFGHVSLHIHFLSLYCCFTNILVFNKTIKTKMSISQYCYLIVKLFALVISHDCCNITSLKVIAV